MKENWNGLHFVSGSGRMIPEVGPETVNDVAT
jgi:hypothetical protein